MGQSHIWPQRAQRFQVLGRAQPIIPQALLDIPGAVVEVQGHSGAIFIGQALGRGQQFRRGQGRRKGHSPGPHPIRQAMVVIPNNPLHLGNGVGGGGHRQVKRIGFIRNLPAQDDAAARFLISLHTSVQPLAAARIQESGGAIFQQFGNRQQRSIVFVLLSHRRLQPENIGQISRPQVVGENPPDGVGVADMQMPVDKSRRNDHFPGVDSAVGGNSGQFRRLAYLLNPLPGHQNRAVPDNAPFRVKSKDEPGVFNFQRGGGHKGSPGSREDGG